MKHLRLTGESSFQPHIPDTVLKTTTKIFCSKYIFYVTSVDCQVRPFEGRLSRTELVVFSMLSVNSTVSIAFVLLH